MEERNKEELITILQDTARSLESKGKFSEAVSVLWQELHLRVEITGRDSEEVSDSSIYLIKLLNKLAVAAIRDGQYDDCIGFLGRALKLSEPDAIPDLEHYRILTLNNASCCHRRLGNTQLALKYAKDALDVGFQTRDDKSLACSHLNACSVLSQAGRHEEALRHARDAVNSSLQALRSSQQLPNEEEEGEEGEDREKENQRLNQEQLATLCIAYHNAGVEFEHLGRNECLQLYRRALNLAEMHLPRKRKMASKFRASLKSAQKTAQKVHSQSAGNLRRPRPSSAPMGQRSNDRLPQMNGVHGSSNNGNNNNLMNNDNGSPGENNNNNSISLQLKMAREKVRELELEMQDDDDNDRSGTTTPQTSEEVDVQAVRDELNSLHERTSNALLNVQKIKNSKKKNHPKKNNKKMMISSASEPVLAQHGRGSSRNNNNSNGRHTESAQSLQIGSAQMIVMGPGLNSGVGPTIIGKGGIVEKALGKKKMMRKRRPASAGGNRKKSKKLPPWARSKPPDYANMSEENLIAIRIFYKLFLVLAERRARAMDIFREFDHDEGGTIDSKELRQGCKALGIKVTKKERKAIFNMIDDDGSGDLDYMELGKEIKKAGKHPPPPAPIDPSAKAVEEITKGPMKSAAKKKYGNKEIKDIKELDRIKAKARLEKEKLSPTKKSPTKGSKNSKDSKSVAGPPKLPSIERFVAWSSSRLISHINLRAYMETHHVKIPIPSSKSKTNGKTVLHGICSNKSLKLNLLTTFFKPPHTNAHSEQATLCDDTGSTPLHLLAQNTNSNLEMIQLILSKNRNAIHLVDQFGKTPLMYAYERSCMAPQPETVSVVDYLIKIACAPMTVVNIDGDPEERSISDRPERPGPMRNNPLHSLLWAFSRTSITSACVLYLSNRIIAENALLLREKNAHGVTPLVMAESSFSQDVQKLFRVKAREYIVENNKAYDPLKEKTPKKNGGSPKKRKLNRWSSAPDFNLMDPIKLMACRVFHLLYVTCDEKKIRSIDVFLDFDVDDSGTVDRKEFSKGVKNLGIHLSKEQKKAVFSVVDKDNSGELEYMEISKEIKKAGRYPPPPAPPLTDEELKALMSPKKKKKKKVKKKKIELTQEQKVWNKVYNLMEKQRVKPVKLFHDIDEDESGIITASELRIGFKQLLDIELGDDEFKACLKICDRDGSNEIDYKEFARAVRYGDPRRIKSMQKTKAKLERLASKGMQKEIDETAEQNKGDEYEGQEGKGEEAKDESKTTSSKILTK